jgi:hypothetical protein
MVEKLCFKNKKFDFFQMKSRRIHWLWMNRSSSFQCPGQLFRLYIDTEELDNGKFGRRVRVRIIDGGNPKRVQQNSRKNMNECRAYIISTQVDLESLPEGLKSFMQLNYERRFCTFKNFNFPKDEVIITYE